MHGLETIIKMNSLAEFKKQQILARALNAPLPKTVEKAKKRKK